MNDYFESLIDHCAAEWRPVPGYEGRYEASSTGFVRSLSRKVTDGMGRVRPFPAVILKPSIGKMGYNMVVLNNMKRDHQGLHRFIARTFLGPANGREVDHIDFNLSRNRLSNIRYLTRQENTRRKNAESRPYMGVNKNKKRWRATFSLKGVVSEYKSFDDRDDALAWRLEMERKYYGGFAPVRGS